MVRNQPPSFCEHVRCGKLFFPNRSLVRPRRHNSSEICISGWLAYNNEKRAASKIDSGGITSDDLCVIRRFRSTLLSSKGLLLLAATYICRIESSARIQCWEGGGGGDPLCEIRCCFPFFAPAQNLLCSRIRFLSSSSRCPWQISFRPKSIHSKFFV